MTSKNDDESTPPEHEHDDGPTMGDVRNLVAEEIGKALEPFKKLLGGGSETAGDKPEPAANNPGAPDLDGMINNAISKVLGDKDKADAEDQHAKEHERIKAATAEKPPLDRPKRARWLGNIYDN